MAASEDEDATLSHYARYISTLKSMTSLSRATQQHPARATSQTGPAQQAAPAFSAAAESGRPASPPMSCYSIPISEPWHAPYRMPFDLKLPQHAHGLSPRDWMPQQNIHNMPRKSPDHALGTYVAPAHNAGRSVPDQALQQASVGSHPASHHICKLDKNCPRCVRCQQECAVCCVYRIQATMKYAP